MKFPHPLPAVELQALPTEIEVRLRAFDEDSTQIDSRSVLALEDLIDRAIDSDQLGAGAIRDVLHEFASDLAYFCENPRARSQDPSLFGPGVASRRAYDALRKIEAILAKNEA